ncbi:MAG: hypothetical protein KTR31_08190 [Myxococcales bacterium]|nr:hypothetical protein [Myxococcales bacterium]
MQLLNRWAWLGSAAWAAVVAGTVYVAPWALAAAALLWGDVPELAAAQAPEPAPVVFVAAPSRTVVLPEPSEPAPEEPEPVTPQVGSEVPDAQGEDGAAAEAAPVQPVAGLTLAQRAGRGAAADERRGVRRRRRRAARCLEDHPNVRHAADGVVEIDRSYVEEVTANLKTFISLGYSRPHDEDGVKGWYISGFSCTSAVHKAGFRRRDVLLRVNGKKTRSWVGVYMLYQRLKKKDQFEVELLRRGRPVTLRFRVVSG